ncbi:MAG TPA: DUF305 domain-containing protein [Gemmatimonadales bacterium]
MKHSHSGTALVVMALAGMACSHGTGSAAPATAPAPAPAASSGSQASAPPVKLVSDSIRQRYTAADVHFMTGMIGHHAQAVLMAGWAPSHGASPSLLALCERIVVGQRDEIATMQRWLRERGQPVPDADASMDMMPGMSHTMMMPGMLTPEQLTQLNQSQGVDFDRNFLTFMIKHHQGALTMVQDLYNSPGAAQDDMVFKFTSDMSADQTIEIERMNGMLAALPPGGPNP